MKVGKMTLWKAGEADWINHPMMHNTVCCYGIIFQARTEPDCFFGYTFRGELIGASSIDDLLRWIDEVDWQDSEREAIQQWIEEDDMIFSDWIAEKEKES